MAVIALTSASGSPGVTTTAVALAFLWPRPVVLVEADPTGGSAILAGYFRGTREYDVGHRRTRALGAVAIRRAEGGHPTDSRHARQPARRHALSHPGRRAA